MLEEILKLIQDNGIIALYIGIGTAVIYFIKKLIDKDPYKFLNKIKSYFTDKEIDITIDERIETQKNEVIATKITGYTQKERHIRYMELREDITVISYLNKWERLFKLDKTFDVFEKNILNEKEIEKRIWNGRLWLLTKVKTFSFGLDKILDDFEDVYVNYNKDEYYNYLSFEYWERTTLDGIKQYNERCIKYGMNEQLLKKITEKHDETVQFVLDRIKEILKIRIYNNDPIIIIEAIFRSFQLAFDLAFEHMDELLQANGDVSKILIDWEIPTYNENDQIDYDLKNIKFDEG